MVTRRLGCSSLFSSLIAQFVWFQDARSVRAPPNRSNWRDATPLESLESWREKAWIVHAPILAICRLEREPPASLGAKGARGFEFAALVECEPEARAPTYKQLAHCMAPSDDKPMG